MLAQPISRPLAPPDPALGRSDFERLARYIQAYSGIKMPPNKQSMVELRLQRRLRALGLSSFRDYCQHLFEEGGLASEGIRLIDAVTTNKTDFFREPEHFRILGQEVAPAWRRSTESHATLRVWSAACSTGAEPYTIAMVLDDLAQREPFRYSILATDICTDVLEVAVSGIYPAALLEPAPPELRRRYVLRSKDRGRDLVRIAPDLRSKVSFGRLNLMDATYSAPRDLDVIFCRNVLIYFDKPTQEQVVRKLADHLRPGGSLFLGHSETVSCAALPLVPAGPSVFRRT
jgi:chemotaxis protein methyltransferase CheR